MAADLRQMQKLLRETGRSAMDPVVYQSFIESHEQGELLAPAL